MRRMQYFILVLILSTLMSCNWDDTPCDPSQPCAQSYSLDITVRDDGGAPVGGIQVYGRTVLDSSFGPLSNKGIPLINEGTHRAAVALEFTLAEQAGAQLDLFDVHGDRVRRLVAADVQRPAGIHRVVWDARDDDGMEVPGGYYRAVFSAFDADDSELFSASHETFLNSTPVAMGETDVDGRLVSTDNSFFPNLILGDQHEIPLIAADGDSLGVYDLSGGTQILLSDGLGMQQWFDVQLGAGRNELELVWCPTCPVPVGPVPPADGTDGVVRPLEVPGPVPGFRFDFSGFYPNPFN